MKPIIIYNKIIPVGRFLAMAIFPILFVRRDNLKTKKLSPRIIRHETIHFRQQLELCIIFFYILYVIFWMIYGYRNSPFEREAYSNEYDITYLKRRPFFAWLRYFKKIKFIR